MTCTLLTHHLTYHVIRDDPESRRLGEDNLSDLSLYITDHLLPQRERGEEAAEMTILVNLTTHPVIPAVSIFTDPLHRDAKNLKCFCRHS